MAVAKPLSWINLDHRGWISNVLPGGLGYKVYQSTTSLIMQTYRGTYHHCKSVEEGKSMAYADWSKKLNEYIVQGED